MSFRLSQRSRTRLAGVHPDLVAVVEAATIEEVWRELSPPEPQAVVRRDDEADGTGAEPRFRPVRRLWG